MVWPIFCGVCVGVLYLFALGAFYLLKERLDRIEAKIDKLFSMPDEEMAKLIRKQHALFQQIKKES